MLHENGQKLIDDLSSLGIDFDWKECAENAGSPEIRPKTEQDHAKVIDYLEKKAAEDEHMYSLMIGTGGIVARCNDPSCEIVQLINTMNQEHLEETLADMDNIECYDCLSVGLTALSYVSFEFSDIEEDGWVIYEN